MLSSVGAVDNVVVTADFELYIERPSSGSGVLQGLRFGNQERDLLFGVLEAPICRFRESVSLMDGSKKRELLASAER